MTVVDGYFDVRGVLRIYVSADYATLWPAAQAHQHGRARLGGGRFNVAIDRYPSA